MKKYLVLLLLGALASNLAYAQLGSAEPKTDFGENIEIRGKNTPAYYFEAMRHAEIALYDQVNLQIDDHKYKVSCRRESQINTNLKFKNCLPNFVRERLAYEHRVARDSDITPPTLELVEFMVADEQEEALNAVAKVIEGNPELIELLVKYQNSVAAYEKVKTEQIASLD